LLKKDNTCTACVQEGRNAHWETFFQMRLCPQGGLELSQMILRPLFLEHHDNVQGI